MGRETLNETQKKPGITVVTAMLDDPVALAEHYGGHVQEVVLALGRLGASSFVNLNQPRERAEYVNLGINFNDCATDVGIVDDRYEDYARVVGMMDTLFLNKWNMRVPSGDYPLFHERLAGDLARTAERLKAARRNADPTFAALQRLAQPVVAALVEVASKMSVPDEGRIALIDAVQEAAAAAGLRSDLVPYTLAELRTHPAGPAETGLLPVDGTTAI